MWALKIRASAAPDRSLWGSFWFEPVGRRADGTARVTPATAMGLPEVYACVRVLAQSLAVMDFQLYEPKVGGGRNKLTKHWLYRLFAKAPNRFQSPFEWRMMLMGHLALRGNAYCQITANGSGEITELLPLHPDRMRLEVLENGSYRYAYTDQAGRQLYFARNEIWHLRGMSSDGYMGMSPIDVARESIGEGLSMQGFSNRFFANDARPGGWLEYPGGFATVDAKNKFRESWQQMQGGANRGKVAVLEKGMKFHEMTLNNQQSQFVESRRDKVTEIARLFGVPPHKIGDLTKSTNNNIEHQSIEFWTDTMLPWSKLWSSSISFYLLGEDSDLTPFFDMSKMMRGDSKARGEYYNSGILAGWLTRNEAREEEGLDPIDGLDAPLRPLNMVDNEKANELIDTPSAEVPPAPPSQPTQTGASARFMSLIKGNAARMARRIVGRKETDAAVLADALAIQPEQAAAWMQARDADLNEDQITAQLIALGETA